MACDLRQHPRQDFDVNGECTYQSLGQGSTAGGERVNVLLERRDLVLDGGEIGLNLGEGDGERRSRHDSDKGEESGKAEHGDERWGERRTC